MRVFYPVKNFAGKITLILVLLNARWKQVMQRVLTRLSCLTKQHPSDFDKTKI